ncbi:erythrocyte membrane protein 1 [Plasmodium falciparum IGH-CR14]|uniref:Erythrocyte membrane protein 1 n=1 Tax=Plasmodium falciparum IGH-CR14 TaxID=580059 RepID=A0A0L1IFG7_PLAFA|nr:erythrocyte membrane protein 1 [Plasmodium falciparum IGH-CR14]
MENNEHIFDLPPSTLDDIHKINDETYNMISTNNIYYQDHNNKIPLDNLGSTNIIYNDITTITFFKQIIYTQIYLLIYILTKIIIMWKKLM